MIREDFLQQNAYHDIDSFCSLEKQYLMARIILQWYNHMNEAIEHGIRVEKVQEMKIKDVIARMKYAQNEGFRTKYEEITTTMNAEFEQVKKEAAA